MEVTFQKVSEIDLGLLQRDGTMLKRTFTQIEKREKATPSKVDTERQNEMANTRSKIRHMFLYLKMSIPGLFVVSFVFSTQWTANKFSIKHCLRPGYYQLRLSDFMMGACMLLAGVRVHEH